MGPAPVGVQDNGGRQSSATAARGAFLGSQGRMRFRRLRSDLLSKDSCEKRQSEEKDRACHFEDLLNGTLERR
jgi:hypothetical protein